MYNIDNRKSISELKKLRTNSNYTGSNAIPTYLIIFVMMEFNKFNLLTLLRIYICVYYLNTNDHLLYLALIKIWIL